MKKRRLKLLAIVCMASLMGTGQIAISDPPHLLPPSLAVPPASPEEIIKAFQISAQTERGEYRAGEPVVLDVIVKNTSSTPLPSPVLTLYGGSDPVYAFDLVVKDERGKTVPFTRREKEKRRPSGFLGIVAPFFKVVPAAGTQEYQIWLNRVYDMTRSGTYSVAVTRTFATFIPTPDGKAIAQVVYHTLAPAAASVKVIAPDPAIFRQAAVVETPIQGPVPQQRFAFVASMDDRLDAVQKGEGYTGQVMQFQIDPDGTLLPHLQPSIPTGRRPQGLVMDRTGRFAYVANKDEGIISQYHVEADGTLKPLTSATVSAGKSPVAVSVSPDNRFVYVSNADDGTVSQYQRDKSGILSPLSPPTVATGGTPSAIAEDPAGRFVYVDTPNLISQFKVNSDGTLVALSPSTIFAGSGPSSITVEPTGHFVYIPLLDEGKVAQLRIGTDGILTPLTPPTVAAGQWPISFSMHPTGHYAYVPNFVGHTLSQFRANPDGGLVPLNPTTVPCSRAALSVTVDPTGSFVYVITANSDISQYRVNGNGTLSPLNPATISMENLPSSLVITSLPVVYQWGSVSGGLQLSARTTKSVFRGDAPIVLAAVLRSANKKPLLPQGSAAKRFQITVKDAQGKLVPLTQYGESLHGQAAGVPAETQARLRKGSVLSSQFYLNRIFDLTVPGIYSVTVEQGVDIKGKTAKIVSNAVPLKIVEPVLTLNNP